MRVEYDDDSEYWRGVMRRCCRHVGKTPSLWSSYKWSLKVPICVAGIMLLFYRRNKVFAIILNLDFLNNLLACNVEVSAV